ncbi:MAG: hypothetical protein ACXVAY_23060 [Mucilaginibacter sp.]
MKNFFLALLTVLSFFTVAKGQQTTKIKFEIVRTDKDNRGFVNQMYVYVSAMSDIRELNKLLFSKYKNTGNVTLQIFYFDDKKIANDYETKITAKINNGSVSNSELERMSKHVIGKFQYISFNNTQDLHIGRESDLY